MTNPKCDNSMNDIVNDTKREGEKMLRDMKAAQGTSNSELDDEIMDLFMEANINAITPKQYTDGIRNLIAQEANKAIVAELETVLSKLPRNSNNEYTIIILERIKELTADRSK